MEELQKWDLGRCQVGIFTFIRYAVSLKVKDFGVMLTLDNPSCVTLLTNTFPSKQALRHLNFMTAQLG